MVELESFLKIIDTLLAEMYEVFGKVMLDLSFFLMTKGISRQPSLQTFGLIRPDGYPIMTSKD